MSGAQTVALVTGLAGSGRSTAIRALEDLGWEAVDNLPLALIPRLAEGGGGRPLALGVDTRTRGFSAQALAEAVEALRRTPGVAPTLLFLDAADDALVRRFAETRRRHPMAPDEDPSVGVERERDALQSARDRADLVIDTTTLSPQELGRRVREALADAGSPGLVVALQSFAYKRGAPRDADMTLDLRFLRNPHWDPALRPLDGRRAEVDAHVAADPLFEPFLHQLNDMLALLLPAYARGGKAYFGLALGCTGGRHRSVAAAERLRARLIEGGWRVTLRHRELERPGSPEARA